MRTNHNGRKIQQEPASWVLLLTLILLCAGGVILVMGFVKACHAAESNGWTRADTIREAVFDLALLGDCLTTIDIVSQPNKYRETNPVLGQHPNRESTYLYFAVAAVAHVGISRALPRKYREPFQYVTIIYEAAYPVHNLSMVLRFRF